MSANPYAALKVVELSADSAGEYTGKLLADQGAEVIKVEPPGGAVSRRIGPFAAGRADAEASLHYRWYNTSKRSVVLDESTEDGQRALAGLLEGADILIMGRAAAGSSPQALTEAHPRLIVLAVTPFGLDGPWADYRSSDLVALALGGPLNSCGYDDHSIPPIRPGGNQAYATAASFAHTGLLLALLERRRSGRGQVVDVSMHSALAVSGELANPFWFYPKAIVRRQTCRHAQPTPTQPALFECADGRWVYFALILADRKPWQALVDWMDSLGLAADLVQPEYGELAYRQANFSHIQDLVEVFFLLLDGDTAYHEGQRRGLPIGITNAPEELFGDEHLAARGFFVEVEQSGGEPALQPGSPFWFSAFASPGPGRAPRLGEHTQEVLGT
ncbi:CoA transferase [Amycolatopsis acidicola]|uniref:CoA transferase n=1 Tax=Amycolatopsis acidicola TaxID=2596893 RepID=A0A5N0UWI4_9PSEU|nr:CoA transferase [Amycolatopsis acidicola]KAA9156561.1 CoA transferase [Amycolatopsis acidicola]